MATQAPNLAMKFASPFGMNGRRIPKFTDAAQNQMELTRPEDDVASPLRCPARETVERHLSVQDHLGAAAFTFR
jgi:hypothetical protein